ncbi:STAS domain-containing protein [Streptomyces sp. NPDC127106]|uniref:STAS domain-containing protein n=1 Tax=Streptomyces sp. NPDC127106 TaxID=3345360 RepID=UPI003641D5B4
MRSALRLSMRSAAPGVRVLEVAGQADFETGSLLRAGLVQALAELPEPDALVADCSGLEFCSAACLNELLRARKAAMLRGIAFRLTGVGRQMALVLRLTETDTVFDVGPAREPCTPPARATRWYGTASGPRGPTVPGCPSGETTSVPS